VKNPRNVEDAVKELNRLAERMQHLLKLWGRSVVRESAIGGHPTLMDRLAPIYMCRFSVYTGKETTQPEPKDLSVPPPPPWAATPSGRRFNREEIALVTDLVLNEVDAMLKAQKLLAAEGFRGNMLTALSDDVLARLGIVHEKLRAMAKIEEVRVRHQPNG
jgi:hypothetical protein